MTAGLLLNGRSQIFPKKLKKRSHSAEDSAKNESALLPCIDYLHGDVADGELSAACCYEYARESMVLFEAARLHRESSEAADDTLRISELIDRKFRCGPWFCAWPWAALWRLCPLFPSKAWVQLDERARAELLIFLPLPSDKVKPLHMNEIWLLDAMGIFDEFKAVAAQTRMQRVSDPSNPQPRQKIYPIIEGWPRQKKVVEQPWVHVLFTLDFRETETQLRKNFSAWLRLPQNKARLAKHQRNPIGTTGADKDRLKDLAAWRLYREFGYVRALRFVEVNRKRDGLGNPRKFHDTHKAPSEGLSPSETPLYSEESGFSNAKRRARHYLAKSIPWEFGEFAEEQRSAEQELGKRFEEALKSAKKTPKISKSSS